MFNIPIIDPSGNWCKRMCRSMKSFPSCGTDGVRLSRILKNKTV